MIILELLLRIWNLYFILRPLGNFWLRANGWWWRNEGNGRKRKSP